jgi:hypothetical protein
MLCVVVQLRTSSNASTTETAAAVMESLRATHSRLADKKKVSASKLQKTKQSLQVIRSANLECPLLTCVKQRVASLH